MQRDTFQACLQCCSNVSQVNETFDDLHLAAFNSTSLKMDFEKIPCTLANTRNHIQRAYYQQQLWIEAPLKDGLEMKSELYGFTKKISWFLVLLPPSLKTFLILVHVVNVPTRMDMSLQGSWNQVLQILQV